MRTTIYEKAGQELSLPAVLKYLVEEGLVTPRQARDKHLIFKGYSEYFDLEFHDIQDEAIDGLIDKEFHNEED